MFWCGALGLGDRGRVRSYFTERIQRNGEVGTCGAARFPLLAKDARNGAPLIRDDDITTQGLSTALALLRSGRDARFEEAPLKRKSSLNGPLRFLLAPPDMMTSQRKVPPLRSLCFAPVGMTGLGRLVKSLIKPKSGLKVRSHPSFFQFMAFLSRGLAAGICSKHRIRWEK